MKFQARLILSVLLVVTCVPAYAQSRKEIYELQERCGKRAAEVFDKDNPKEDRKGLEDFENHYSVRLNKCFILEMNTTYSQVEGKSLKTRVLNLIDVNDNKLYGSFSPLNCDVQDKTCHSEQEFRALVRPFMED
jgi:hypothetical protein